MTEKVTDHLGNEFPSVRVMCTHYGVTVALYQYRRSRGLSKRDALESRWKKKLYKYNTHVFTDAEGLLAYAGVKSMDEIEDKVIIIK